jgi:cytochrome c oxidase assembly factor 6
MGWFGSSKAEKPNAISREDRSRCWEARDAYFSCLDAAEVVVPGTEGSKCAPQRNTYEQNCAKSWVCRSIHFSLHVLIFLHRTEHGLKIDYFNQRRVLAEKQKPLLAQAAAQTAEARRS